jgi:protoporphyrinogen/coproporphyrinogen III oxidase
VGTFAVVGGGISGLVAAHTLASLGEEVVLLEGSDRLGGKLHTVDLEGATVEAGADCFVVGEGQALELCGGLGIDDLREPRSFGAWICRDGRLHRMPEGTLGGIPTSVRAVLGAEVLSPRGRLRALADLILPGPLTGPDIGIGGFVARRFGREVAEVLVDPLLAGTRAGALDELSLAAATPALDAVARRHRSVILGTRRSDATAPPRFLAPVRGMGAIAQALTQHLEAAGAEVRTGARVTSLVPSNGGYRLETRGTTLDVSGVVLAVPAYAAAEVLTEAAPDAARLLAGIRYASVGSVALAYPPGSVDLPPTGSGILVPRSEQIGIAACTWFSSKWPHLAPDDGRVILRCFLGRADRHPALDLTDDDLAAWVHAETERMIRVGAAPLAHHVARWEQGLPQYDVGHLQRVGLIESALRSLPRLVVTGAASRGTGVTDCVRWASEAARAVRDEAIARA